MTLSDQEIAFLLNEWGNTYLAAAAGAEQLAGQFAKEVNYSSDDVQFAGDDLQQKYMTLATQLRAHYKRKGQAAQPFDGSNDCSDWQEVVDQIRLGLNDNRREGANAPVGVDVNPLTGASDGGYTTEG